MSTTADQPSVHPSTVAADPAAPGAAAGRPVGPGRNGSADLETDDCILTPGATPVSMSAADRFMRRLLRLPEDGSRTATAAEARSLFQTSLLISTCRCLLMYIVLPFVLPAIGIAKGVGPYIGVAIGALAMVAITYSIRRFWRANHSKRWHYTIFGTTIICFLIVLAVQDLATIFSGSAA